MYYNSTDKPNKITFTYLSTAATVHWVRTFAPQAEGWEFESQPLDTQVVKTGSDCSTDKRSTIGVSDTGLRN